MFEFEHAITENYFYTYKLMIGLTWRSGFQHIHYPTLQILGKIEIRSDFKIKVPIYAFNKQEADL